MKSFLVAAFATLAAALPFNLTADMMTVSPDVSDLTKRGFSCSSPVRGLSQADCNYLNHLGFAGQGTNPGSPNNYIWQGDTGPSRFTFHASAGVDIILIFWDNSNGGSGQGSFMTAHAPYITWTIPDGQSVTISVADGHAGAWSGIYNRVTGLDQAGQVWNVWGEWSTGAGGTLDVSRLPNMHGNHMAIDTNNGCKAQWTTSANTCAYYCTVLDDQQYDNCYEAGHYAISSCSGANTNVGPGPSGGCDNWNSANIYFYN